MLTNSKRWPHSVNRSIPIFLVVFVDVDINIIGIYNLRKKCDAMNLRTNDYQTVINNLMTLNTILKEVKENVTHVRFNQDRVRK